MKQLEFKLHDIFLSLIAIVLGIIITFGFGYFIGRAEQIELNKSSLKQIPDINHCFEGFSSKSVHGS